MVPWACRNSSWRNSAHYLRAGADPGLIRLVTYLHTAPQEHAGFGKFGNDAKNEQAAFLAAQLLN